jgi:integrase
MDMQKVESWLSGIPSKHTQKNYRHSIVKFEAWYKKPVETLIGSEDASKVMEQFFCYLKEKHCQNTARNQTNGVIQFLKSQNTEIKLRKALNIYKTVLTIRDHPLSIAEVQSMAKTADIREQLLLKIGLLGLRVGDASLLEWKTFDIQGEPPIEIIIPCKKEDTIATTYIDAELKEILDQFMNTIDKKNPYLFQSKRNSGNLSEKRLDAILKELFERAGLKTQKILRWHCFRKLVLRTCAELGINQWASKIFVGKSVPSDIMTYIQGANLKEDFIKLSNVLKLKPSIANGNGKTKEALDTIMRVLRTLVEKEMKREGITFKARFNEPDWLEILKELSVSQ